MYDYFRGKIADLSPTHVTIDCQGVGYHLQVSLNTYSAVKDLLEVKLFAHQVIREDVHLLFGFSDPEERYLFRELLSVSGVGATTARIILSGMTYQQLRNVIAAGDVVTLQKVKGIGAKTAQRIVLDLRDKLIKGGTASSGVSTGLHNTGIEQALSALLTLGFARASAEKALQQASKKLPPEPGVEDLIKIALSYL